MLVWQIWGEEALQFQEKLLNSSGLGDETYFPDSEALLAANEAHFSLHDAPKVSHIRQPSGSCPTSHCQCFKYAYRRCVCMAPSLLKM